MNFRYLIHSGFLAVMPMFFATAGITRISDPIVSTDGVISVEYDLSSDAIVTCEVLVDDVPIPPDVTSSMYGDVNRRVAAGDGRIVRWASSAAGFTIYGKVKVALCAWPLENPPDYMAVDLTIADSRRYYASSSAVPYGVTSDVYKTDILLMRKIPAAGVVWRMGQENGEIDGVNNLANEPGHMVRLTNDFYAAVYETTQLQYARLTGSWPANFKSSGIEHYIWPVETVSYDTLRGAVTETYASWPAAGHSVLAGSFMHAIRDFTGIESFDLPTEAEWEYACRAGTGTPLNSGKPCSAPNSDFDANMAEVGWCKQNGTKPVGVLAPNAWGLYDCHGNVNEFCLDWYSMGDGYTSTFAENWQDGAVTVAPVGVLSPSSNLPYRSTRGGGWYYRPGYARSAARKNCGAVTVGSRHDGFRLFCRVDHEVK